MKTVPENKNANPIHIDVMFMKTQTKKAAINETDKKIGSGTNMAAVRIRGAFNMRKEIKYTLKMLRLNRKNHCVLLRGSDSERGMLQKAKDYITFGEISDEMLKMLIAKRGRIAGNKKLSAEQAENALKEILSEGKSNVLKPVFRLTPPSGGFREVKQHFPRGDIGYRGEKINELLKKMI